MAKTDLNERMQKLKVWAKANANKLFIWGMAALVALRGMVFFLEMQSTAPEPVAATVFTLPAQITDTSPDYINVQKLIVPLPEFSKSDYYSLFQTNIFDPKLVKDERQIDDEADRLTAQAIKAFNEKDYAATRRALEQALSLKPKHRGATDLMQKLEAVSPSATPSATPGAGASPPAGGTPAPGATPAPTPAATPGAAPAATPGAAGTPTP